MDAWERDIINHPAFQRLRRIRQLAWTDLVYPGAMHTRFEHSIGAMHTATLIYDALVRRSEQLLRNELKFDDAGIKRFQRIVRLAALMHDIGHGPFSHACDDLFPMMEGNKARFRHEHYSAAIVREQLRDVIENHPHNINYRITANEIASLLDQEGPQTRQLTFLREIIAGQIDADRVDYLLRDSHHAGVSYGRYDMARLLDTLEIIPVEDGFQLGVSEGGIHAAEGLILARYFMFTQIYFHKTRMAYDFHLEQLLRHLLPNGTFPAPIGTELIAYLDWDDWKVMGEMKSGNGGDHAKALLDRKHVREIYHTPEVPSLPQQDELKEIEDKFGSLVAARKDARKSWYKRGASDVLVREETAAQRTFPLSDRSDVINKLNANNQVVLYANPDAAPSARQQIKKFLEKAP